MLGDRESRNRLQTLIESAVFSLRHGKRYHGKREKPESLGQGKLLSHVQAQRAWHAMVRADGSSSAESAMPKRTLRFSITSSCTIVNIIVRGK